MGKRGTSATPSSITSPYQLWRRAQGDRKVTHDDWKALGEQVRHTWEQQFATYSSNMPPTSQSNRGKVASTTSTNSTRGRGGGGGGGSGKRGRKGAVEQARLQKKTLALRQNIQQLAGEAGDGMDVDGVGNGSGNGNGGGAAAAAAAAVADMDMATTSTPTMADKWMHISSTHIQPIRHPFTIMYDDKKDMLLGETELDPATMHKVLLEAWKALTPEEQLTYMEQNKIDRQRYNQEVANMQAAMEQTGMTCAPSM